MSPSIRSGTMGSFLSSHFSRPNQKKGSFPSFSDRPTTSAGSCPTKTGRCKRTLWRGQRRSRNNNGSFPSVADDLPQRGLFPFKPQPSSARLDSVVEDETLDSSSYSASPIKSVPSFSTFDTHDSSADCNDDGRLMTPAERFLRRRQLNQYRKKSTCANSLRSKLRLLRVRVRRINNPYVLQEGRRADRGGLIGNQHQLQTRDDAEFPLIDYMDDYRELTTCCF